MTAIQLESARRLLCALQKNIRDTLIAGRRAHAGRMTRIAAVTSADTIYYIDRLSEAAILAWFDEYWPKTWPVELVMEGLEDGATTFPRGTKVSRTRFKCILDPIDGTRAVMYDKRAGWILAGLAVQRGRPTHLGDIVVAAMTELPTSKQDRADQISAIRGVGAKGVIAHRCDLRSGARTRFVPRPSQARTFDHGFASLVRFFPEGKALTAQIEEELWRELRRTDHAAPVPIFDDQYLSTGGQLYELLVGHDRMIGDIRPLVFEKLKLKSGLCCHPYDICTELILTEAGGIVETPNGRPLRVPLDTCSSVAWVGYANPSLARSVRPILRRLLRRHLA